MIKIAVMGFGTVGSGVLDVIAENGREIANAVTEEIAVKYILDIRQFPDSPYKQIIVSDFALIENDPEVKIVVETIGGVGIAYDFTKRCLLAGKSVVTSNKELVAKFGHELIKIAKEKNVNYLFEASVGGGIPIIRPLTQCLASNRIEEIYGIMNGTTNYILTEMIQCGRSFDDALTDAQERGFAEQNPKADIEGIDACNKICILSDLCFGRHVQPSEVPTQGIADVTAADVQYARQLGCAIKLLGRALRTENGKITAYVAPHLISCDCLLSNVDGVMNAIMVYGNALGEAMFYGAGAGSKPTASAVVADVMDAAKHMTARKLVGWAEGVPGFVTDPDLLSCRWFIRTGPCLDEIGKAFDSLRFVTYPEAEEDEYAFVTPPMSGLEIKKLTQNLSVRSIYRILRYTD